LTLFAVIAIILTILAVGLMVWPLVRSGSQRHPVAAVLIALTTPAAVLVLYLAVSNYDWLHGALSAQAPGSMEEAVAALEFRLKASPEDEEGWVLLGNSYLNLDRPADAVNAFQRALELSRGQNLEAKVGLAEAQIVLDPVALTGAAGKAIEEVLAVEPRNPKALWYGGMQALARGDSNLVRDRWQGLLALEPPERIRQIILTQLAALDEEGTAEEGVSVAAAKAGASPASGAVAGIAVQVSVSPAQLGRVGASAPVFIFLRDAGTPGPPLAVLRRQASDLPLDLQISDADVMLPGRSLAAVETATVVARVANGGDPIARPGDLYGEGRWQRTDAAGAPVTILIDRVVEP